MSEDAKIGEKRVVTLHYTLKSSKGEIVDSSQGSEPLTYLHGIGEMVPGFEKQLAGKRAGEKLSFEVPPGEGYGERKGKGPQKVPRAAFEGIGEIEVGMALDTEGDDGRSQTVWIAAIDDSYVTIDINHPLAGETLCFEVEVIAVRKATADEVKHGHAHGAHGHHHH
jgi:FKBP-type peptidyl-prolyl cis-trans isomerase SlyD